MNIVASHKNLPIELVNLIIEYGWHFIKDLKIKVVKIHYNKIQTISDSSWFRDHVKERIEAVLNKEIILKKRSKTSARGWIYLILDDQKQSFIPEHLVDIEYII